MKIARFTALAALLSGSWLVAPAVAQVAPLEYLGSFGGFVNTAFATDSYVYLGQARRTVVAEWQGSVLVPVASVTHDEEPNRLFVDGNRAYATFGNGFDVINLDNPAAPAIVGGNTFGVIGAPVRGLFAVGGHIYVAQESQAGTSSFWILNAPATGPRTVQSTNDVDGARDVVVAGSTAFLVAHTNNATRIGLYAFDVSNPAAPVERSALQISGARRLDVESGVAYVVGGSNRGVTIVNVSDPGAPALLSQYGNGTRTYQHVDARGSQLYLIDNSGLLHIVDVSNPSNPVDLAVVNPEFQYGFGSSIHVASRPGGGQSAYAAGSGQLVLYDVQNPAAPSRLDAFREPPEVRDHAADPNLLVTVDGLSIWLHDPSGSSLEFLSRVEFPNSNKVTLSGSLLVATDWNGGVRVYDVTDARAPALRAQFAAPANVREMGIRQNILYLLTASAGAANGRLQSIDVSNPASPTLLDDYEVPGNGIDLWVPPSTDPLHGSRLAIAYYSEALATGRFALLDAVDPANMTPVVSWAGLGPRVVAIELSGKRAVTASMNGAQTTYHLEIFDLTDPLNPASVESYTGNGSSVWDLVMLDDATVAIALPEEDAVALFSLNTTAAKNSSPLSITGRRRVASPRFMDGFRGYRQTGYYSYLFAGGGYASYGYPEVSGSYGTERFRYEITTGGGQVTLMTGVSPSEAAADGCTVTPTGGTYDIGSTVTLAATAATGWVFKEWTGSLSGSTTPADLVMDTDKEVIGNFQPTLVLDLASPPENIMCPPIDATELVIARPTLTAFGTDWQFQAIAFAVPTGTVTPRAGIEEAILLVGGTRVQGIIVTDATGRYVQSVQFPTGVVIADGQTLQMTFIYVLKFPMLNENGPCGMAEKGEYQVLTGMDRVLAEPVPMAARPGVKLPAGQDFTSPKQHVGCVLNETAGFVEAAIQRAIDDQRTRDGHALLICPGIYEETVSVTKSLEIASEAGPAKTWVRPPAGKAEPGDVIAITAAASVIQGLQVSGGTTGIAIRGAPECFIGTVSTEDIRRNVIVLNGTGILITGDGAVSNSIAGNRVGVNLSGSIARPNSGAGVLVEAGRRNTVGGLAGNVISGNGLAGVMVAGGSEAGVFMNLIGTNATGTAAIPNGTELLGVGGLAITGGRDALVSLNQISGNRNFGIYLGPESRATVLTVNRIGVDSLASAPIANTSHGIYIRADSTRIGAEGEGYENVISGNGGHGILIEGPEAMHTEIIGNFIGTNADTLDTLGNAGDGVHIKDSEGNRIWTPKTGARGIVAFNAGSGVAVVGDDATGNLIRRTAFIENGKLAIDLADDGVTPNDLGPGPRDEVDEDEGPNDLVNFPVGIIATPIPGRANFVALSGILEVADPWNAVVDIYSSPEPDSTGFGEAVRWLGTANVDSSGVFVVGVNRTRLNGVYLSATATVGPDSSTSEFSWVCHDTDGDGSVDSDGDGLCDSWEEDGIDYDGDGEVDLDLSGAPFHAEWDHKDLFVEIDWMAKPTRSLRPLDTALADIRAAFAAADVPNPDGVKGITLHLMPDEAVPWQEQIRFRGKGAGTFHGIKYGNGDPCSAEAAGARFGTNGDRAADNCKAILGARALAFRYMVSANEYAEHPRSGGIAEKPGNDFLLTLATWADASIKASGGFRRTAPARVLPTARRRVEAGTIMHELGHTLGLGHGGEDDVNCKPNYLSIMSYSLQLCAGIPDRVLDYSSFDLADLDESSLNENHGVGDVATRRNIFNQSATASTVGPRQAFTADRVVNWDGTDADGDGNAFNDPDVEADIDYFPNNGCNNGGFSVLKTQNDWNNLLYDFRWSSGFLSGGIDADALGNTPEFAEDQAVALAMEVDYDGDGYVNALDNCPQIANPTQQDLDGDGIGDVCESRASDLQLYMHPSTDTPRAGTPFEYLLTVHNAGPDSTESVVVVDTLDARYTIEAVTPETGTCDVGTTTFLCDLGGLATFGVRTVTLRVNATEAGVLPNEAWVSSMELDPDTTSNRARLAPTVASGVNNERRDDLPDRFDLLPAYPNPFAVTAIVPFDVREEAAVRLVVYDVLGREVARLVDTRMPAGRHRAVVDGARWAPGVYLARIVMGGYTETTRLVLVR